MTNDSALRPVKLLAGSIAILVTLSGCVHRDFARPIGEFSSAMAAANSVASDYYSQLNQNERELYLLERAYNSSLTISSSAREFAGVVPQDAIDRRLRSLALLSTFTARLSALSGHDAPARFATATSELTSNINDLVGEFSSSGDEKAAAYNSLFGQIIAAIGQAQLERQRDQKLRRAIIGSDEQVRALITLIRSDLSEYLAPLRLTGGSQAIATMVEFYNNNAATMTKEQREAELARIGAAVERRNLLRQNDPVEVMAALEEAHGALVTYANSPAKPADVAELAAAIDLLVTRVRPVLEALRETQED